MLQCDYYMPGDNALFIFFFGPSHHCVRLSCPGLAISEDANVVSWYYKNALLHNNTHLFRNHAISLTFK